MDADYEENAETYDEQVPEEPSATDKQINYIRFLLSNGVTKTQASQVIGILKGEG
jgi:hypothetical protein